MRILVVDASTLITLARADEIRLLEYSPHQILTVPEVYRETVDDGRPPTSQRIEDMFHRGAVATRGIQEHRKISGISETDSRLVHLAEELEAAELLSDDQKLLRRAQHRGLHAHITAVFVQQLYRAGTISEQRRDRLFASFLENQRYVPAVLEAVREL